MARRRGFALAGLAVAFGLAAGLARAGPAPPAPIPVIIDTDIGDDIDDAFALALALASPRLEVVAVTTAWGDTQARVALTRRLLGAMGRADVAVGRGAATADAVRFTQRRWAMGAPDARPAPDAVAVIRAWTRRRPGEISLIALAPMVNVQALIARDPAAFRRLKRVVAMGGSINVGYDPGGPPAGGPSAEYNVAAAPAALASVLDAGRPVTLFPLDSTKVAFDAPARERLFAQGSGATGALAALYGEWRTNNAWGQVTPSLFDVVPVAWLIDPGLCSPTPMRIAVDAKGFTRPEIGGPNASVCLTAQPERVRRLVLETLAPTSGPTATKAP